MSEGSDLASPEPAQALQDRIDRALALYGVRVLDNIDLSKVPSVRSRARIVGNALMERGDARAFAMGRDLVAASRR